MKILKQNRFCRKLVSRRSFQFFLIFFLFSQKYCEFFTFDHGPTRFIPTRRDIEVED